MNKIIAVVALFAAVNAAPGYQASSYSSYNDNHNSVQHIDSAPAPVKYAVPAAPIYSAPAVTQAIFAAPVAKAVVPVPAKIATVSYAAPVAYSSPVAKYVAAPSYTAHEEEYAPAKYEYTYGIEDAHTGDFHSQEEHRDGDHVVGQYSLHEADGTVRIVKYSDDGHGFNAIVEKQGQPTQAPVVYKKVLAVAAPQYHH